MFQATEDHWKETNAKMSTLVSRYSVSPSVYKMMSHEHFYFFLASRGRLVSHVVFVKSKRHAFLVPYETSHSISIHIIHINSISDHLTDHYLLVMCVTAVVRKVKQSVIVQQHFVNLFCCEFRSLDPGLSN